MLLPLRFNDGTPAPDESVADTLLELEERFGAVSRESQAIRGRWRHDGQSYRDDLVRVFVDVPDEPESRAYFLEAKTRLKARFQQLDMRVAGGAPDRYDPGRPRPPAGPPSGRPGSSGRARTSPA